MHTAFVLAAGLGTRLRPLTDHRPKALVPVCGVPMLAYALALCARHGLTRAIVNAHHLADQLAPWAGEHEGVHVTLSVERPAILGTGGGLRAVRDQLADRFAIVNADVLNDVDLGALLRAVPSGGATMALRPREAERYGVVAADASDTVVDLVELATAEPVGAVRRDTHFTGVHAMDRRALELVPDGFSDIVRTAYVQLVPARRVAGLRHGGTWLDVGDPAAYLDANLAVLDGIAVPLDPFERAARHERGNLWIGPGARVGDARLRRSAIGAGAVVADGADLDEVVVWDGARVPPGRLRRAIVYDGGVLVP